MSQPVIWCCPICQRSFEVGCCPEHTLENGAYLMPYTAADNKSAPQRVTARRPVQQEGNSDGRSSG